MNKTQEAVNRELQIQRVAELILYSVAHPQYKRHGFGPGYYLTPAFELAEAFVDLCEQRLKNVEAGPASLTESLPVTPEGSKPKATIGADKASSTPA